MHSAAIADIDLDGTQEIFFDGMAFDGNLIEKWSTLESYDTYNDYMWPVVVQGDADDAGEVGFLFGDRWVLADSDGTTLARVDYRGDLQVEPGPPCVADFDGDGTAEIAWPSNGALTMMELDGTVDWTAAISDESAAAGCAGFDFDADGAVDVAYGDEVSMAIYSGRTGERMWEATAPHRSWTHVETPAVADVNADGHADLLFVDNDGYEPREEGWGTPPFLTMVSADPGRWPPAGTWPLQEYAVTNVLADGSVPADPDPSWLANNTWRALPSPVTSGTADLAIDVTDACLLDCSGGLLDASFQVGNVGSVDAPAGAVATLAVDGSDDVQTVVLPAIPAGTWLSGRVVELAFDPTVPPTVRASVSSDGTIEDCEGTNDEATFLGPACGE